jgi:hypothetical protein
MFSILLRGETVEFATEKDYRNYLRDEFYYTLDALRMLWGARTLGGIRVAHENLKTRRSQFRENSILKGQ